MTELQIILFVLSLGAGVCILSACLAYILTIIPWTSRLLDWLIFGNIKE